MAISRYGDAEESLGRVQILLDLDVDLAGRDVILVEDIVDTGLTLSLLLLGRCGLADPRRSRCAPCSTRRSGGSRRSTSRYAGFECPDRFVVGLRAGLRASGTATCPTSCGRRPRGAQGRPRRARAAARDGVRRA